MSNETKMLITRLPFAGFYESIWSNECDHAEENECENFVDDKQEEEAIPHELRLDSNEYAKILFRNTDYRAMYMSVAKTYVDAFNIWASKELNLKRGKSLGLTFESMDSPREYNFTTDRIYAHIPEKTIRALFTLSKREKHARLKERIKESFTSRSGFISYYNNDLADWLEKPVTEWDHNELCALIEAVTGFYDGDRSERGDWHVYDIASDGGFYDEYEGAVDWTKVDADVAELRAEKEAALHADDPSYVAPAPRCPDTPDMFSA